MRTLQRRPIHPHHRGFSLVEMLFAMFILGIGVISIAALFPVGLTQQLRSTNDILGPTIARNALATIRNKVSPDDFGWIDINGNVYDGTAPIGTDPLIPTIPGDTTWRRPAFFTDNATVNGRVITDGSIDLFINQGTDTELPHNTLKYGPDDPPQIIITQQERYFPAQPLPSETERIDTPTYVWDCAFRRFQGRMQVAIFVYRVRSTGASDAPYHVPASGGGNGQVLPYRNILDGSGPVAPDDPWVVDLDGDGNAGTTEDVFIPGTERDTNPPDFTQWESGWQAPGQWLLDQNNNVHRILAGRRNVTDGPVELTRPIPGMPPLPVYSFGGGGVNGDVVALWYLPPVVTDPDTGEEWQLTPVYIAVREL